MDINQLLLSKFLLNKGEGLLDMDNEMSSGLAISLFQDAVELVLWAIAGKIEANIGERDTFYKIWDLINHCEKPSSAHRLPLKEKMSELNKARVGFKHYGILPAPKQAFSYHSYTSEFLRISIKEYFDLAYDDISLVDLIRDNEVKNNLKEGERLLREHKLQDALASCENAYQKILSCANAYIPELESDLENFSDVFDSSKDYDRNDLRAMWYYLLDYLKHLRHTSISSMLEVKMRDVVRYERYAPTVNLTLGGKTSGLFIAQVAQDKDVAFSLRFVTNLAIAAQSKLAIKDT